jgi:hypothetical protein
MNNMLEYTSFKKQGNYCKASALQYLGDSNSYNAASSEATVYLDPRLKQGTSVGKNVGNGGVTKVNLSITNNSVAAALADFALIVQPHKESVPSTAISGSTWGSVAGAIKHVSGTINTLAAGATAYVQLDLGPNHAIAFQAKSGGSDNLTNGTFTGSATSWTLGSGWSYTSNTVAASAASSTLSQAKASMATQWTAGTLYEVQFTITNYSAGYLKVGTSTNPDQYTDASGAAIQINANGSYSVLVLADSNAAGLVFTGVGFTGTIDTISAKECAFVVVTGSGYR